MYVDLVLGKADAPVVSHLFRESFEGNQFICGVGVGSLYILGDMVGMSPDRVEGQSKFDCAFEGGRRTFETGGLVQYLVLG